MGGRRGTRAPPDPAQLRTRNRCGGAIGLSAVVVVIVIDEGRITIGRPRMDLFREIVGFGVKSQVAGAADVVLYESGKLIGDSRSALRGGAYEIGIRLIQGVQAFGGLPPLPSARISLGICHVGDRWIREQYVRLTRAERRERSSCLSCLERQPSSAVPAIGLASSTEQ